MKEVVLTKGLVATVDDEDFDRITAHKWTASRGSKNASYYAVRGISRQGRIRYIYMHREVLDLVDFSTGDSCRHLGEVDHINGDGLDNRKSNLRIVSHAQNRLNSIKHMASRSRYKGVSWFDRIGKWVVHYKQKHVGYFDKEEDAALAYNNIAYLDDREHSSLNKIPGIKKEDLTVMPASYSPRVNLNRYRGVRRKSYNCFEAYIQVKCKRYVIGYFRSELAAVEAFNAECERLGLLKRIQKI